MIGGTGFQPVDRQDACPTLPRLAARELIHGDGHDDLGGRQWLTRLGVLARIRRVGIDIVHDPPGQPALHVLALLEGADDGVDAALDQRAEQLSADSAERVVIELMAGGIRELARRLEQTEVTLAAYLPAP